MEKVKQNELSNSTTELGFVHVINSNLESSGSEDLIAFQREVELEDGNTVTVESVTPEKMKSILNNNAIITESEEIITNKTPGEIVEVYKDSSKIGPTETKIIDGVVQITNNTGNIEPVPDAEEVMIILNDVDGTSDEYEGMGGTEEEIEAILDEKNAKIKPENIKEDVQIFDVTGTAVVNQPVIINPNDKVCFNIADLIETLDSQLTEAEKDKPMYTDDCGNAPTIQGINASVVESNNSNIYGSLSVYIIIDNLSKTAVTLSLNDLNGQSTTLSFKLIDIEGTGSLPSPCSINDFIETFGEQENPTYTSSHKLRLEFPSDIYFFFSDKTCKHLHMSKSLLEVV